MTTARRIIWHIGLAVFMSFFIFVRILAGKFDLPIYVTGIVAIFSAFGLSFALLITKMDEKFLTPLSKEWQNSGLFLILTILGALIDPTYSLFSSETRQNAVAFFWPIRLVAQLGGGVLFAILAMMVIQALKVCHFRPKSNLYLFIMVMILINLGACFYIARSSTVYFWDNAGFFETAKTLSLKRMDGAFFQSIVKSMLFSDYNSLLSLPISLLMRIFGSSRHVFVLSIVNLYELPAVFLLLAAAQKQVRHSRTVGVLLLLITPIVPFMAFTGFVDIAPMSVGLLAVLIWLDHEKDVCARGILCGILLVICFIMRRTFFFFSAAFGLAALSSAILCERKALRGVIMMGVTVALSAIFFMQPFLLEKVLGSNYGSSYSAYDFGIVHDYFLFVRYFGIAALTLAFFAVLYLLVEKACRMKALFCGLLALICFVAFTMVQTHGQQHLLLYLPAFYGICLLLAVKIDAKTTSLPVSCEILLNSADAKKSAVATSEETVSTWGTVVRPQKAPKLSTFDAGLGILA